MPLILMAAQDPDSAEGVRIEFDCVLGEGSISYGAKLIER